MADLAVRCLHLEVDTWPKPGLVSHVDTGSHDDMTADMLRQSAVALKPCFGELAAAAAEGAAMDRLRRIGLAAETAMFAATGGVNTHRGAIFGLGLLCAAAGARAAGLAGPTATLGAVVADRWAAAIIDGPVLLHSHGMGARLRHGARGARFEAAGGFPTLYATGLPALHEGRRLAPDDPEAARVQACFALMAALEDTNLLHRGGTEGLAFARAAASTFLDAGGVGQPDWRQRAAEVHHAMVARHLSPGGSADLLAMTLFVDAMDPRG